MSDPNRNECSYSEKPNSSDTISRQAAIEVIDAVFPVDPMKSEYAQGIACGAAPREKTGIFDKNGKEICVGDVVHYRGKGMCAHGVVTKHDTYGYAIDDDRPKTKGRRYDLHNEGIYRIEAR